MLMLHFFSSPGRSCIYLYVVLGTFVLSNHQFSICFVCNQSQIISSYCNRCVFSPHHPIVRVVSAFHFVLIISISLLWLILYLKYRFTLSQMCTLYKVSINKITQRSYKATSKHRPRTWFARLTF